MMLEPERIKMGKNTRVGEGTVLGAYPLHLEIKNGRRRRRKCDGDLVIEDNVNIGANCVLNFGAEKDTIIREGVFIGHLSSVGHDSEIGRHTVISAHVCVCGCVKIGEWCYIAPQTVIKPHVTIGDYTMIGLGSVVVNDISSGVIAYGSPCKVIRENKWRPQE